MTTDRDGWLREWAETRIWPSDRDKFLDWYDQQPDSWFPGRHGPAGCHLQFEAEREG